MRRPGTLLLALAAALLAPACGSDSDEPKRAVDARTEVLHFFPADQPLVALLDTSTPDRVELARSVRAISAAPALAAFATGAAGYVERSGLELRPLGRLLTDDDPEDGIAASQAGLGLSAQGRPQDALIVVVSDQTEETEATVERIAADAGLAETGGFHQARVFEGEGIALAVRDGVVIVGRSTTRLRRALALRDSNQDEQLDEDQVADLLRELGGEPLVAYANLTALERTEPAVGAMARRGGAWIRSLRRTAIGVEPGVAQLRIEIVAEVEPADSPGLEVPLGEEPEELELGAPEARRLLSGRAVRAGAFGAAVSALAPLVARARLSGDELRATIVGSR